MTKTLKPSRRRYSALSCTGGSCSDSYEDFDQWDRSVHVIGVETMGPSFLSDIANEVTAASQQALLEIEESILQSKVKLAQSRSLSKRLQASGLETKIRSAAQDLDPLPVTPCTGQGSLRDLPNRLGVVMA